MIRRTGFDWRDRLHLPLTWYVAGVAVLTMIPLVLAVWFVVDRSLGISAGESVLTGKRAQIAAMAADLMPLRGLTKEMTDTRAAIDDFYAKRIPRNYSQLTSSVGAVATKAGVRLTQITYSQGTPGSDLVEISMDAGVNGNYRQIMLFVNGLERDRVFFVIRALTFAGQQGGTVNLRVRVSAWMRPGDAMTRRPIESAGTGTTAAIAAVGAPRTGGR